LRASRASARRIELNAAHRKPANQAARAEAKPRLSALKWLGNRGPVGEMADFAAKDDQTPAAGAIVGWPI
jgi:hypothetical protein